MSGLLATRSAGSAIGEFLSSAPLVRKYEDLKAHVRSGVCERVETGPVTQTPRDISCSDVSFRYGNGPVVLDSASLTAEKGKITAIVGANGAGKTTLVRILGGTLKPTAGTVHTVGRESISELSQDFHRYELTVRQFVTLGIQRAVNDAELFAALACMEARDFVSALPLGLDTQLGEQWGGVDLSGGQWQRLALARTVLSQSPVWILDEPTSAVDAETETKIFGGLSKTSASATVLLVSHRAWTLRAADEICVLDGGRVVERGSYGELVHRDGMFRRMFLEQRIEESSTK
ncbi:ATP-binding cassette domain-containing protein [Mobilicoccus pelagius]